MVVELPLELEVLEAAVMVEITAPELLELQIQVVVEVARMINRLVVEQVAQAAPES